MIQKFIEAIKAEGWNCLDTEVDSNIITVYGNEGEVQIDFTKYLDENIKFLGRDGDSIISIDRLIKSLIYKIHNEFFDQQLQSIIDHRNEVDKIKWFTVKEQLPDEQPEGEAHLQKIYAQTQKFGYIESFYYKSEFRTSYATIIENVIAWCYLPQIERV